MNQPTELKQYNFTEAEVSKLFTMQDQLNTYIHPEWKNQGFNWSLAIIDECMEIHGHLGWKWWKKDYQVGLTDANLKQVQLEVIDILHFVVSSWTERGWEKYFLEKINDEKPIYDLEGNLVTLKIECVKGYKDSLVSEWTELAHSVGLTKQQILETYAQKFVLNKFRQDHGYKTGEYCKEWQMQRPGLYDDHPTRGEDNYWLEQIVNRLKQANHSTTDEILLYSELERLYNSRLNKA